MLYLLDANVLIDANRDYYPLGRVPEFWEWLEDVGRAHRVKVPLEIYEEIREGKGGLATWAKKPEVRDALLFSEEVDARLVARVVDQGYASDLTDVEVEKIGRDAFLVAYALVAPSDRCVVTTEASKPRQRRANRHLPDVCGDLGVSCAHTFELLRTLNFTTKWRSDRAH